MLLDSVRLHFVQYFVQYLYDVKLSTEIKHYTHEFFTARLPRHVCLTDIFGLPKRVYIDF